jgi:hypothetical protein
MRPLSLLPASLLLFATGTGAQTTAYPPPDAAPIASVQVSATAKAVRIKSDVAKQISGAYEMSNGWNLRVLTSARYIDAIIDDQPPIRLVAVAPYRFASGDHNVTMDFKRRNSDHDLVMSYVPDVRLGQRVVLSSRLAQR